VNGRVARGVWRLADPKVTLASAASLFVGLCAAAAEGPLSWGWLAATVGGIFLLEAAKNASGEIFDLESDRSVLPADRSPFSGGKRVIVDGLLTPRETAAVASVGYAGGIAIGLAIVFFREKAALWLGVAGVALAYFYNAPPFRLAYHGLGEAAVALSYGPLIGGGAYLVQRGDLPPRVFLLLAPLGVLIGAFLWVSEFPDYPADVGAGKRNLVVRLGRPAAARLFPWLLNLGLAGGLALPALGFPVRLALGTALAVVPCWLASRALGSAPEEIGSVVSAQGFTLAGFVAFAVGSGVGLL
jgi:1,4-dihydroxy-2-naphthoate polyprenyltransferase